MVKGWARLRIQVRSLFLEVIAETVQRPSSHGLPRCFVLALRLLTADKPWVDPLDQNKNLAVTGFMRNNDIHELHAYSSELLDLLPQMGEALVTIYTPTLQRLQMAVGALRDAVLMPSGLRFAISFGVSLQIADTSLKHENFAQGTLSYFVNLFQFKPRCTYLHLQVSTSAQANSS